MTRLARLPGGVVNPIGHGLAIYVVAVAAFAVAGQGVVFAAAGLRPVFLYPVLLAVALVAHLRRRRRATRDVAQQKLLR